MLLAFIASIVVLQAFKLRDALIENIIIIVIQNVADLTEEYFRGSHLDLIKGLF